MMQQNAGSTSILNPSPLQDHAKVGDLFDKTAQKTSEPRVKKRKAKRDGQQQQSHHSVAHIPTPMPDAVQQHDGLQNILDSFTPNDDPKSLQNTLDQIEQDVTTIMSSIAQKKPKVTLHQLNTKLDFIISILNNSNNNINNCQLYGQ